MNFESVHNYYERPVHDEVVTQLRKRSRRIDQNFAEDVACVALNKLPPRYIRFDIDLAFYLTSSEREAMERSISDAVREAIDLVQSRNSARAAREEARA